MKKICLIIFCFAVFFQSCDPYKKMERAKKRISRIIYRNPGISTTDTILIKDTVIVKGTNTDTTFFYKTSDTIRIQKEKLEVKYFFNTKDSTVFLEGKCKGDTIYRERVIYKDKVEVAKHLTRSEKFKIWMFDNWWWILGIIIIIVVIVRIYLKGIKPI